MSDTTTPSDGVSRDTALRCILPAALAFVVIFLVLYVWIWCVSKGLNSGEREGPQPEMRETGDEGEFQG